MEQTQSIEMDNYSKPALYSPNITGYHSIDAYGRSEKITSVVFGIIICVAITFGNGMVILAVKLNPKLRSVTNISIISLALADSLVGFISIPFFIGSSIYPFIPDVIRGGKFALNVITLDVFSSSVSVNQLTAISLERCFAIVAPMRHRSISVCYYYVTVFSVWAIAVFNTLLFSYQGLWDSSWILLYIVHVNFIVPIIVMTASYTAIFRAKLKGSSLYSNKGSQINSSSQTKLVFMFVIITGVFIASWSPFYVGIILQRYQTGWITSTPSGWRFFRFTKWLSYCNSAANPLVYAYGSKKFRQSFKVMFHASIKCKRFEEVNREFILKGQARP